jgi:hypothetical protein
MRRIANPLRLGTMHEAAFVAEGEWVQHFQQKAASEGITGELRVADLLGWIDEPKPRGLDPIVAQLVVATFAEQTDRAFYLHGSQVTPAPEPGRITAEYTLREESLPSEEDWKSAHARAMAIFGLRPLDLRRGRLVAIFGRDLVTEANRYRTAAHQLASQLDAHADQLQLDHGFGRLATAQAAADLLDALAAGRSAKETVEQLARAELAGPADRTGRSISSAAQVTAALAAAPWDTFEIIASLPVPYAARGAAVMTELRRVAQADELTAPLVPALKRAQSDATALLREATGGGAASRAGTGAGGGAGASTGGGSGAATAGSATNTGGSRRTGVNGIDEVLTDLRRFAEAHGNATIEVSWRVVS